MTLKKPLALYAGKIKEIQAGDTVVPASLVEIDMGLNPLLSGHFTVSGFTGLTSLMPVSIKQAALPYTGKGTLSDEAEMDTVNVSASVLNPTTIQAFWNASGYVVGNFKFFVRIGV